MVDLQLLGDGEDCDLAHVAATCVRLFHDRRQQAWPPVIAAGDQWVTLYVDAAEGLDVMPDVEEAVIWANEFIRRITVAMD